MNVSLSDLYNSAAKSPEDKSEAETEDKTSAEEKPTEEEKEPVEEKTEEGETEKKDEAATEETAAAEHKKKFKLPNIPKALKNIRSKSKEREKNKVRNELFCYSFRNYYCLKEKKC